jgi:hypothetical protein
VYFPGDKMILERMKSLPRKPEDFEEKARFLVYPTESQRPDRSLLETQRAVLKELLADLQG